ncbi:MAG: hypothetical protein FJ221_03930 [Lentisphaerae bacterium]|nr:hypothetical protein [Lentisphaerota bacterium]
MKTLWTAIGLAAGVALGAAGQGREGGLGSGGGGGLGQRSGSGGGSGGGSGVHGSKLGEFTPAPSLPAPNTSAGAPGETESQRKAARLQSSHGVVAGQEAFLRTLRARLIPGTWTPDHVVDPADDSTLLHVAVRESYPEAVRYLLDQGANPRVKDLTGATPLDLARKMKVAEIVAMLEKAAAPKETGAPAARP